MVRPVAMLLVPLFLVGGVLTVHAQEAADADAAESADTAEAPAAPAVVQDPKQAKLWAKAAEAASRRGDGLLRQKKKAEAQAQFADALMAWQRSIEFADEPASVFGAAGTEVKLGKFDQAFMRLQNLLARTDVGALRAAAQTMLDETSMQVGLITLAVTPDETLISVAGKAMGKTPLKAPLVLLPGEYTVEFAADGYQPKQVAFTVEAGTESERKIELEGIPINVEPEIKPVDINKATPRGAAGPRITWLYAGGGATAVLGGAAMAFGLAARSKYATYTDINAASADRENARVSGRRYALWSDVSLGAGALALATTCYYYFAVYRPYHRKAVSSATASVSPKVLLGPWVEPGVATGVSLQGGF
ncbi:MAG: PEGA domain-containing protein [Kofleriaceae bacterium]|nr:PEGA domain-containing protein [Kofleriaceae bacterium]